MATIVTPLSIREKVRTLWADLRENFPELAKKQSKERFDGFCQLMFDQYGYYLGFTYERGKFKGMISDMIWDLRKKKKEKAHPLQALIRRYKNQVAQYNADPDNFSF
jgi:hypothetical protein